VDSSAVPSSAVNEPPGSPDISQRLKAALEARPGLAAALQASLGEELTVSFGEERISPRAGSFCTVGPFFYKTRVRSGETTEQAFDRALEVVRLMAEKFRKEKLRSFLKALSEFT